MNQSDYLSILSRAPAQAVKDLAEALIPELGPIEVLRNRTGLVMLPMNDAVTGTTFYLGEVLVAEAHVRAAGAEGYAACLGRDLHQALAIALLDAAYAGGRATERIGAFVQAQAAALAEDDARLLHEVAATRVDLETF